MCLLKAHLCLTVRFTRHIINIHVNLFSLLYFSCADSYHWPSEDLTQDSEPLQQEYESPQQAYAIVQSAVDQWLSTSTDQDSGTPRDARATLQQHHYEHSKQSSMHQHTGELFLTWPQCVWVS